MSFVIGIDPSMTSTGIVVVDKEGFVASTTVVSKNTGNYVLQRMNRIHFLVRKIRDYCEGFPPEHICIEDYSYSSISSNLTQMAEFGGILRYVLTRVWQVTEIAPTNLKKHTTGKGMWKGGGKTPMIVALTKRHGVELANDDLYDAFGLALMARQIVGWEQPATAYEREAIDVAVNGRPKKKARKRNGEEG